MPTNAEKQLAEFLIILFEAAGKAIQSVDTNKFDDLADELLEMIKAAKKIRDGGDVC